MGRRSSASSPCWKVKCRFPALPAGVSGPRLRRNDVSTGMYMFAFVRRRTRDSRPSSRRPSPICHVTLLRLPWLHGRRCSRFPREHDPINAAFLAPDLHTSTLTYPCACVSSPSVTTTDTYVAALGYLSSPGSSHTTSSLARPLALLSSPPAAAPPRQPASYPSQPSRPRACLHQSRVGRRRAARRRR